MQESRSPEVVLVRDLAAEWRIDPTVARRYLLLRGFGPKLRRPRIASHRGQQMLALLPADADAARDLRRREYSIGLDVPPAQGV